MSIGFIAVHLEYSFGMWRLRGKFCGRIMKTDYCQLSVFIIFITIPSEANLVPKFVTERKIQWRNIFNISTNVETAYLDVDYDSSVNFKESVLKSIHGGQSVTVYGGASAPNHTEDNIVKILAKKNHNIIFTTKFLNPSMLEDPLLEFMLKSHWSILLIIASTEDSVYNCDQLKFSEEAQHNIEEFLNSLWHKYRMMHVFLNLPYVCPNNYVVFNDIKPTDIRLYNRTIKIVNTDEDFLDITSKKTGRLLAKNYPLVGNIFHRFPTAIRNCSGTDIYIKTTEETSGGFCGMDGLIMSDIVTHFKFNLSLPTLPPGYNRYGYQQANGVLSGILGHVVRKDVDVSFNSRFMIKYTTGLPKYRYLHVASGDVLCAILRHPGEEPLWQYPVNTFTRLQWMFILATLIAIGILMRVFARIKNSMRNRKTPTLLYYILTSINAGLFGFFFKQRKDLLLLRAACLYSSITILATYQGYINYVFTTRITYEKLHTLSDLAESGTVIQTSPPIYNLIKDPYNDITAILSSNTIVLEDTDSFAYVMNHANMATLERKTDATMMTRLQYTTDDGKPMLYVLDECLRDFYLSYICNIEFPFRPQLHVFMMHLIESGLPDMYYKWTMRALGLETVPPSAGSEPRPAGQISLGEEVIAFSVLQVGYVLSVGTFVLEIWWARRQVYPYVP